MTAGADEAAERFRVRFGLPAPEWMEQARVPSQEMLLFCRQLAALVSTGVPIYIALDILHRQAAHATMIEVLRTVGVYVESGYYLSQAASLYPNVFGSVFLTLVRVGENTGALAQVLELIAVWYERDHGVRQKVKAALTYPAIVMVLALLACYFLMSVVAPGFLEMFQDRDDLPWPTRVLSLFVHVQQQPAFWILLVCISVGAFYGARNLWRREEFRLHFYRVCTWIPVMGSLLITAAWARYFAAYTVMSRAGISPLVTLPMAAKASGDPRLEHDLDHLMRAVMEGDPVATYTRKHPELYPSLVTYTFDVSDSTGKAADLASYMERYYRLESEHRIEVLATVAEPIVLLVASSFVLMLMLALMLPLYGQMNQLGP